MKSCLFLAISALVLASTNAMSTYRKNIPNGELFEKTLGHTGNGDELGPFGKLYSENREWAKLCKLNFPGTTMTNGAAFGDPCCEWKSGAAPQTITPWAAGSVPTTATVCKSKDTPTVAPTTRSSAPTTAPVPATPTTPAPGPGTPTTGPDTPTPTTSTPNLRPRCKTKNDY